MLFAVASPTLYVSCGYSHVPPLGSLMSPFHLSAFQPSKVATLKDEEKRLYWGCRRVITQVTMPP